MDTVVGKRGSKTVLLVLSERVMRKEIIFKIPSKSQSAVVNALDKLERKLGTDFSKIFKTITCDNGCENLDFEGVERSVIGLKYTMHITIVPGNAAPMKSSQNVHDSD